jgi:cytosine/adenosine deaminase-related metal-dependent hydrolase
VQPGEDAARELSPGCYSGLGLPFRECAFPYSRCHPRMWVAMRTWAFKTAQLHAARLVELQRFGDVAHGAGFGLAVVERRHPTATLRPVAQLMRQAVDEYAFGPALR